MILTNEKTAKFGKSLSYFLSWFRQASWDFSQRNGKHTLRLSSFPGNSPSSWTPLGSHGFPPNPSYHCAPPISMIYGFLYLFLLDQKLLEGEFPGFLPSHHCNPDSV